MAELHCWFGLQPNLLNQVVQRQPGNVSLYHIRRDADYLLSDKRHRDRCKSLDRSSTRLTYLLPKTASVYFLLVWDMGQTATLASAFFSVLFESSDDKLRNFTHTMLHKFNLTKRMMWTFAARALWVCECVCEGMHTLIDSISCSTGWRLFKFRQHYRCSCCCPAAFVETLHRLVDWMPLTVLLTVIKTTLV